MLLSLALPIILCAVALFFASFLSWMVLQLHRNDWKKLPREDEFLDVVRKTSIPAGSYMFPGWANAEEAKSEALQKKRAAGPTGIVTVFEPVNMGKNLGLTFAHFLVVTFCLAYLATLALPPGAAFMAVFRFLSTAAFLAYVTAIVSYAIWFKCRIVGYVIESLAYAAITGAIFGAMWPAA